MARDLGVYSIRYYDGVKTFEEIRAAQFVEMNAGARVTDGGMRGVSLDHATPTRRLRE